MEATAGGWPDFSCIRGGLKWWRKWTEYFVIFPNFNFNFNFNFQIFKFFFFFFFLSGTHGSKMFAFI